MHRDPDTAEKGKKATKGAEKASKGQKRRQEGTKVLGARRVVHIRYIGGLLVRESPVKVAARNDHKMGSRQSLSTPRACHFLATLLDIPLNFVD